MSCSTGEALGAADERAAAAAAPGFHEVLFAQGGQGFADGHGGDAELRGQVDLDREAFAVVEQAEVDGLGDAQDDFVGPADRVRRGRPGETVRTPRPPSLCCPTIGNVPDRGRILPFRGRLKQ